MRRTNYQRDKRQKDLDKKRKKEEKQQRKLERKGLLPDGTTEGAGENAEAAPSPKSE